MPEEIVALPPRRAGRRERMARPRALQLPPPDEFFEAKDDARIWTRVAQREDECRDRVCQATSNRWSACGEPRRSSRRPDPRSVDRARSPQACPVGGYRRDRSTGTVEQSRPAIVADRPPRASEPAIGEEHRSEVRDPRGQAGDRPQRRERGPPRSRRSVVYEASACRSIQPARGPTRDDASSGIGTPSRSRAVRRACATGAASRHAPIRSSRVPVDPPRPGHLQDVSSGTVIGSR